LDNPRHDRIAQGLARGVSLRKSVSEARIKSRGHFQGNRLCEKVCLFMKIIQKFSMP